MKSIFLRSLAVFSLVSHAFNAPSLAQMAEQTTAKDSCNRKLTSKFIVQLDNLDQALHMLVGGEQLTKLVTDRRLLPEWQNLYKQLTRLRHQNPNWFSVNFAVEYNDPDSPILKGVLRSASVVAECLDKARSLLGAIKRGSRQESQLTPRETTILRNARNFVAAFRRSDIGPHSDWNSYSRFVPMNEIMDLPDRDWDSLDIENYTEVFASWTVLTYYRLGLIFPRTHDNRAHEAMEKIRQALRLRFEN